MIESIEQLGTRQTSARAVFYGDKVTIGVGIGTCGVANGADKVIQAIQDEVEELQLDFVVRGTGCIGYCEMEPLVDVLSPGLPRVVYHKMTPEKAHELVRSLAERDNRGEWAMMRFDRDMLLTDVDRELTGELNGLADVTPFEEHPFFRDQRKVALLNCGFIDPHDIEQYLATGGYSALAKVVTGMTPEQVIGEVQKAGLRGRGGGGFPTGRKWQICHARTGDEKYIICNGDEGDPGAFMDRSIMEGDPHSVLEGMTIGAYAIGATRGYIYVRAEYPLAVTNLSIALEQSRELGLLGEKILGSDFCFDIAIVRGAGAFVCGEETGLIASIEGNIGSPRQRPPYPAESGLWGKPTNINNVETWANVPVIIERGAEWFAAIGTENSKGTKVFSLVGKVCNTGLVEVPMGTTMQKIVYDIGGGILKKRKFKAVQTGGPSGGCIPESQIDLPVDFDRLTEAGAMMGSGGLIVMDERTCMVEVAKYFLAFLVDESCGKCTACREGIAQMHDILSRIVAGKGRQGDIELLEELAAYVKGTSLCQLGGTAPNPVLSTLRYFRDEYEAHIEQKKCPAGVCQALIEFSVDEEACKGCGLCVKSCPTQAISGEKKQPHHIDADACITCGSCYEECPFDAIKTG